MHKKLFDRNTVPRLHSETEEVPKMTHLGESYRQKRIAHWLSQGDAAEKAKINRSKLCLFERGSIELSEKELKGLDRVYRDRKDKKVPLRALLGGGASPDEAYSEPQQRKLRRQWADITQSQLAKLTGISRTRLSRWESGRDILTADEENLINKTLDGVIEELHSTKTDPWRIALSRDQDAESLFNQLKAAYREQQRVFFETQAARLEHSSSLDDPIVCEVISSLRREIAKLQEQRAEQPQGSAVEEKPE